MLTVVGSYAVYIRSGGKTRPPLKDVDFIGQHDVVQRFLRSSRNQFFSIYPLDGGKVVACRKDTSSVPRIFEFETAWPHSTGLEFLRIVFDDPQTKYSYMSTDLDRHFRQMIAIPSYNALLKLKLSHRYKKDSPHFLKTMTDIIWLRKHDLNDDGRYDEWLKAREKETLGKHPNLNQDKRSFFSGDSINYIYDHDTIHEAMKRGEVPAYRLFQKDGAQVAVDRSKFEKLTLREKLNSVLEESLVLALERSQIPFDFKPKPKASFDKALMKVCTSITSGWWREFAWEHYYDVQAIYPEDYVSVFQKAVQEGVVKVANT